MLPKISASIGSSITPDSLSFPFYYSCGSFEFLSRNRGRSSSTRRDLEDEISDEDDRLFFPQRNDEKEAILRQIQTLNDNLGMKIN